MPFSTFQGYILVHWHPKPKDKATTGQLLYLGARGSHINLSKITNHTLYILILSSLIPHLLQTEMSITKNFVLMKTEPVTGQIFGIHSSNPGFVNMLTGAEVCLLIPAVCWRYSSEFIPAASNSSRIYMSASKARELYTNQILLIKNDLRHCWQDWSGFNTSDTNRVTVYS